MIVAGVMSGTSADGINVALVRMGASRSRGRRFALLGHAEYPYSKEVRKTVLAAMNARQASVADLSRLNFLLGELYGEAVLSAQRRFRLKAELVGCHGQTLYHQGEPAPFLGHKLAVTWQTGEGAIIAARVGVPVVSDFRPADMAAGGKGAPLVPFLDYLLYRDKRIGRIVQNIGGIANLTAIPAGAPAADIVAFDTGPGNMVIDALTERLFAQPFDRDGRIAASGTVRAEAVAKAMRAPFFRRHPPKTAGREQFGREFAEEVLRWCGQGRGGKSLASAGAKNDAIATATALTANSIAEAVKRSVLPLGSFSEVVVSGGGAKNSTLMAMLANSLRPLGLQLRSSDEFGIPAEAKEAVAFALLAYETWNRRPSNVPSATGAKRPAILGKISYA
ncbi:MAG TPA: anhydro-N-acetylmuramic acid kinase [Terriglobales bacterium]|nr:anhydro-N-acetylmuramic acid kinase [Terriglobales bacterium]